MKKISDFFNKLNQKNKTSSETSEVINLDKSNSQATSADKDDAIRDLSEALNKSFLSTNNISIAESNMMSSDNIENVDKNVAVGQIYIDKPKQPVVDFPQDNEKRRFVAKWYNLFSWLE